MNYYVSGFSWRNLPAFPIDIEDFTQFQPCFDLLEEKLRENPNGYFTLQITLEEEDPADDEQFIVQFRYAEPGKLNAILCDNKEVCLHDNYLLFVTSEHKIKGVPIDANAEEDPEDIVKIILDYGGHIAQGVQWAAYLLKENADGGLAKYFDDLPTQELH
jgi:hypothetical protein